MVLRLALLLAPFLSFASAAGETPAFFTEVTVLLVISAIIAYICFRLGLVPIIGFLVAGVLIGPNALGLVRDAELIDAAAELGVIFLLFTIGIEFSLAQLARIRRLIFVGGGLQVGVTVALVTGLLALFGVDWRVGVFTGCLVALSSTAIVLKLFEAKGGTGSPIGNVSLGVLIFQDLAVVVMVLVIPMLGEGGGSALGFSWALLKAGGLIVVVLTLATRVMPHILEAVARTCSPEIFLLTIVAICLGTAYITSLAGVSLSLGAFLAGLLVSESRFGQQALGEILPLQIIFSAAFFISVGLLLDLGFVVMNLPLVLAAILGVLVIKTLVTTGAARLLGYPLSVALPAGFLLAQVGEFSFVLERAGREVGLSPAGLGEAGAQTFIATTVLLMGATPFLGQIGRRVKTSLPTPQAPAAETLDPSAFAGLQNHVIIAGYGDVARRLTGVLGRTQTPFVIVTLSPTGATEAEEREHHAVRGDYAKASVLSAVGLARARLLVVADDDPAMTLRVISVVRGLAPELYLVGRTRTHAQALALKQAGANAVISDEYAVTERLITDVLEGVGLTSEDAQRYAEAYEPPALPPVSLTDAQQGNPTCTHTDQAHTVSPLTEGCEECLKLGDRWVHLRVCMSCGHVGCCDDSKNKHATGHFHGTGHPIIRSLERGEDWAYCYEDEATL
ncbi:MAG: Inner membrane protein, KefB/KefC family [uncultured Truepera sp.]|uniref:Inner membrane protein, KefB/KefC family n=1 Tax=uncultured Truepera sp. TaxID=543023 RepID=A0A6J4VVX4_9DEIN|nr:MAG: Inner membrane protein, KefB/KefC family [uncultured Truepera sp.]